MNGDTEYIKELLGLIEELRSKIDELDGEVIKLNEQADELISDFKWILLGVCGLIVLVIGSVIIFS